MVLPQNDVVLTSPLPTASQVNLATAQGVFDTAQIILDEFLMNSRMWLGEGAIDPLAYFKYVVSIAKNRPETCWHTHGIDHCFLLLELR